MAGYPTEGLGAEADRFFRDGFLVIPGAISRADAEDCRRTILGLVPRDLELPLWWESRYGRIKPVHRNGSKTYDPPELLHLYQNEVLYRIAALILGSDRLRVYDGSVGITIRHDRGEPPYRDEGALSQRIHIDNEVPLDVEQFRFDLAELEVGGCFYLTDVAAEGGGIAVVPGGHLMVAEQARSSARGRLLNAGWTDIQGLPDPVEVTGNAGDFVLLHYLTPHAATHNRLATTRVAQFLRWARYDHASGAASAVPAVAYSPAQTEVMTPLGRRLLGVDQWP